MRFGLKEAGSGWRATAAGAGVLAALMAAPAAPAAAETQIKVKYNISLSGLKIGELRFTGTIDETRYEVEGSGRIAGLPQFFTTFAGETRSSGTIDRGGVNPDRHVISYNTVKKDYETRMTFRDRSVRDLDLTPPYKAKKSRVPILDQHKTDVIDPLSAAVLPVQGDGPLMGPGACDRTLPIFDGRERFDMRLVYKGLGTIASRGRDTYSGTVVICRVDYVPIAGHRRDDDFMDKLSATDAIEVWLAPVPGERALVLYRARVPTPFGAAVIVPKAFVVSAPPSQG